MSRETISESHLIKYLKRTGKALAKVKISAPDRTFNKTIADDFYRMAQAYFEDAGHFFDEKDHVNAFACVNYAHGWLDAGARLGLFDVGEDDQLFTLSE